MILTQPTTTLTRVLPSTAAHLQVRQPPRVAVAWGLGLGSSPAHDSQTSGVRHGDEAERTEQHVRVFPQLGSCNSAVMQKRLI